MCGAEGIRGPAWRMSRPVSIRGAASKSAETNCEEPDASISTVPPATAPFPLTVIGRAAWPEADVECAIRPPSCSSARTSGAIGRARAASSPSKTTSPRAKRAIGGTKRMTVPAKPTSTRAPRSGPGVTTIAESSPSTPTPIADKACAINAVSREMRGRRMIAGSSPSAAASRYRFVSDFEPGTLTFARTGPEGCGAAQLIAPDSPARP